MSVSKAAGLWRTGHTVAAPPRCSPGRQCSQHVLIRQTTWCRRLGGLKVHSKVLLQATGHLPHGIGRRGPDNASPPSTPALAQNSFKEKVARQCFSVGGMCGLSSGTESHSANIPQMLYRKPFGGRATASTDATRPPQAVTVSCVGVADPVPGSSVADHHRAECDEGADIPSHTSVTAATLHNKVDQSHQLRRVRAKARR